MIFYVINVLGKCMKSFYATEKCVFYRENKKKEEKYIAVNRIGKFSPLLRIRNSIDIRNVSKEIPLRILNWQKTKSFVLDL